MPAQALQEIEETLAREGIRHSRLIAVSPPNQQKGGRCAYRVELEDGGTIKARRLESADAARRLRELRAGLDEGFAPALANCDRVLLEAWIDGLPLTDTGARVEEAGALLGRLHAREVRAATEVSTRAWLEDAMANLERFGRSGTLGPDQIASLGTALRQHDPGAARVVLVHRDFCGENMVIDGRGSLRVIDNEWFSIDPAGVDLGRTFSRWPMPDGGWDRFLRAYRSAAELDLEALHFWQIAVTLFSLRIRLEHDRDPDLPLGLLRSLAARANASP